MISTAEMTALQRSAAMLGSGQSMPVDRDQLLELCEEIIHSRQLLQQLGTDLRAVAAHAPRSTPPQHK